MPEEMLWILAGVTGALVLAIDAALSLRRRRRRREAARRRQLVNQAAVWHGYPGNPEPHRFDSAAAAGGVPSECLLCGRHRIDIVHGDEELAPAPEAKVRLEYALGEEPIPPGLHAQHRLMGEEIARGRRVPPEEAAQRDEALRRATRQGTR